MMEAGELGWRSKCLTYSAGCPVDRSTNDPSSLWLNLGLFEKKNVDEKDCVHA